MYYIYNNSLDPYFNLACEEYLLHNMAEDVFMLWVNSDAIIVGRNQNTMGEIHYDYVKNNGIAVVRRLTGGGAVFHDMGNLNFTFITKDPGGAGFSAFAYFGDIIVGALKRLGLNAELSGRNDLLLDGKKFSGNATCVHKGRVLHHGTLMLNILVERLADALKVSPGKIAGKGVQSVRSRVTNINEHLETPVSIDRLIDVIADHTTEHYQTIVPYELTGKDISEICELADSKYRTFEWNYGTSPIYNFSNTHKFGGGTIDARLAVSNGVITGVRLYGDYFSNLDIAGLEGQLIGVRHEQDALALLLNSLPVGGYFLGATAEDVLSALI